MIVEPLEGKARQSLRHKASVVALEGSVRSGKTWCSLIEWLDYCRRGPAGPLLMTGRTERTVITNLVLPLQQMLGSTRVSLNRGLGMVTILGRQCMIVGANNEESVTKIQGRTLAGALVDECSSLPESYFDMLYSRLSVAGAQLWLTSNPESPMHWLKVNWLDKARLWIDRDGVEHVNDSEGALDLVRVSFKLEDNAHNLPAVYIERLKAAYSGLWYRRYVLGDWCVAAGAVYDSWDPMHHVLAPDRLPPVPRLLCAALDYGTTAPTAGILLGISAEQRPRLVVVDEWAPPSLTDAGLSVEYRKWIGARQPERVIIDPSAESFHRQLWSDGVHGTVDADNAVIDGIRTVASLLAVDRLVVSSACTRLLTEIPSYAWDPKATAKGEDKPVKQNDHWCDALRYGIFTTQSRWRNIVKLTIPVENEVAA